MSHMDTVVFFKSDNSVRFTCHSTFLNKICTDVRQRTCSTESKTDRGSKICTYLQQNLLLLVSRLHPKTEDACFARNHIWAFLPPPLFLPHTFPPPPSWQIVNAVHKKYSSSLRLQALESAAPRPQSKTSHKKKAGSLSSHRVSSHSYILSVIIIFAITITYPRYVHQQ